MNSSGSSDGASWEAVLARPVMKVAAPTPRGRAHGLGPQVVADLRLKFRGANEIMLT